MALIDGYPRGTHCLVPRLSPEDSLLVSAGFIYNPLSNCYDENKDTGKRFLRSASPVFTGNQRSVNQGNIKGRKILFYLCRRVQAAEWREHEIY